MAYINTNNSQLLLVTRHLKRDGDTEHISADDLVLAKTLKQNVDDVAREWKRWPTAVVSGYKTINNHFGPGLPYYGRTHGTAMAFGYADVEVESDLSYSPDTNWRTIPFGKPFKDFLDVYTSNDVGTQDLARRHKHILHDLLYATRLNHARHVFTHDSRIEAACAIMVPQYAERLGASMDNGETLAVRYFWKSNKYEPIAIIRRTGIQDIV